MADPALVLCIGRSAEGRNSVEKLSATYMVEGLLFGWLFRDDVALG